MASETEVFKASKIEILYSPIEDLDMKRYIYMYSTVQRKSRSSEETNIIISCVDRGGRASFVTCGVVHTTREIVIDLGSRQKYALGLDE